VENKETARKKIMLWNDLDYLGKHCLRGVYQKLITVLVVCNLDGIISRLAEKCKAGLLKRNCILQDPRVQP